MMGLGSLTGLVLIAGCIMVFAGFSLFPWSIYTASDVQVKLSLVDTYRRRWVICQALVLLGSTTCAAGLALVTALLQGTAGAVPAVVGLFAVVPGVAFWNWHLATRIVNPRGFARGELLSWPFYAYSVLILAGLAAYGIAFWLEGSAPALGIGLFASAAILLGFLYVFKNMPPFVYYAMILAIALVLFI